MGLLLVNRSAVLVRPREPFLEWCKLDDESGIAEEVFEHMRSEPAVYLIPDFGDPEEQRLVLQEFWPVLFESMLEGWLREPTMWPKDRTFEMFTEWLEVQQLSAVDDSSGNTLKPASRERLKSGQLRAARQDRFHLLVAE